MSEVEFARKLVAWLEADEWEVFQEVQIGTDRRRADIVARRGPVLHVFETKLSMSISVIEQALQWRPYAHLTSIVVPERKGNPGLLIVKRLGLGMVRVREGGDVLVLNRGDFTRPKLGDILARSLREEHKTYAEAGNNKGRFYSAYASTCDDLRRYVEQHPGCELKQALANIQHHYQNAASARASLSAWLLRGDIEGVRAVGERRNGLRLYPAKVTPITPAAGQAALELGGSAPARP